MPCSLLGTLSKRVKPCVIVRLRDVIRSRSDQALPLCAVPVLILSVSDVVKRLTIPLAVLNCRNGPPSV